MNRNEFIKYIENNYGALAEYPWFKYPTFAVFRHANNKKWFAVVMTIDKQKLGINKQGKIDVVNLKCDSFATSSFCTEKGIYPAYHMNKNHWISVALDGSVDDDVVKLLTDISYSLTNKK